MNILTFVFLLIGLSVGLVLGTIIASRRKESQPPAEKVNQELEGYCEVMRLLRDEVHNERAVYVHGHLVHSPQELSPNESEKILRVLNDYLHTYTRSRTRGASPITQPQPHPTTTPAVPVTPRPEVPTPCIPSDEMGSLSIPAQINSILQNMLRGSPLDHSGICLLETPDQGVIVQVGSAQYEGIDAVPDPMVQEYIRSAVKEWERRFTSTQQHKTTQR
ncbi:MAG: hypothetical protein AB1345_10235 [Chloroflexota bacterium]